MNHDEKLFSVVLLKSRDFSHGRSLGRTGCRAQGSRPGSLLMLGYMKIDGEIYAI